eukprot:TRINITY_DN64121_c0_g1_i1.p1 TRINITY_DN64121_c0_g1~~TRINITY_DN64121_c0_g1_i1.p1  ORF type:complete len:392 (+),score=46.32 TRINITY_DN64121_c0_g1_i1:79-1254(+)
MAASSDSCIDVNLHSSASAPANAAAKARHSEPKRLTKKGFEDLLSVGPVRESADRAHKTRSEAGAKGYRARVAHETLEALAAGGYRSQEGKWVDLRQYVMDSVNASALYLASQQIGPRTSGARFKESCKIEVRCTTTLVAAAELALEQQVWHPGVLNFASARNPGGGFTTGAQAQEESIARASGIYPCLAKYMEEIFIPNRNTSSGPYTHDMIYSPGVPIFRDDDGCLLDSFYLADFVTSAAPNLGVMRKNAGRTADEQAALILRERSERVLEIFASNGNFDIVLGAWGCGVFQNDPAVVAQAFKTHLDGRFAGVFRRVLFAITVPEMAKAFVDVLGTQGTHPLTSAVDSPKSATIPEHESAKPSQRSQQASRKGRRWQKHRAGYSGDQSD